MTRDYVLSDESACLKPENDNPICERCRRSKVQGSSERWQVYSDFKIKDGKCRGFWEKDK